MAYQFHAAVTRSAHCAAAGVLSAAAALTLSPAHASDLDDCTELHDLARTITGCTALINAHWGDRKSRAMVFNNRAIALSLLGQDDDALVDHDKAIALDPDYANARYNRAHFHTRRGHYQIALEDFDRLLLLEPGSARAHLMRGFVLEKLGAHRRAIDDFSAAIAIDPSMSVSYNNRGVARRKSGALAEALADFDAALAIAPHYLNARINRAKTLAAMSDHVNALVEFTTVIEQDATATEAWLGRGRSHEQLGHVALALSDYREAAALDPLHADAVSNLQRLSRNN